MRKGAARRFRLEAEQAKRGEAPPAHVFLSAGAIEQRQMSDDITALKAALDARKDSSLKVDIKIFEDETHNSVLPAAVTRGLLKVFDAFPAARAAIIIKPSLRPPRP